MANYFKDVKIKNSGTGIRTEGPVHLVGDGITMEDVETPFDIGPDGKLDFTNVDLTSQPHAPEQPPVTRRRRVFAVPKLPWHKD